MYIHFVLCNHAIKFGGFMWCSLTCYTHTWNWKNCFMNKHINIHTYKDWINCFMNKHMYIYILTYMNIMLHVSHLC